MPNASRIATLITIAGLLAGCGKSLSRGSVIPDTEGGNSCSLPTTAMADPGVGANVITIGVGTTALCGSDFNIPCADVTVCEPGTNNCQTISDVLIDTGSYGLRLFKQAISPSLNFPGINDSSGNPLAECAQFGSANDWGSVVSADVILGGENAVTVPIQIIDSGFGTSSLPSACDGAEASPSDAGINGILGVGLFAQDCGLGCVGNANYGNLYYSCSGGTCSPTKAPLSKQVTNPVAMLPVDNNGVILNMPAVPPEGTPSVTGSLILGIDTEANNSSSGYTKYSADSNGFFSSSFSNNSYAESFIDSGSNGYFLPNPGWNQCSGFFCTGQYTSNMATVDGALGSASAQVCFTIGDAQILFNSGNDALSDIGADIGFSQSFDWGLPFFYGRQVFVGIESSQSKLGTGPYWAF